tara:strand:- start:1378 stop:1806 length:429 start_codon:yes stop_codon:yes gene_type:complete
METAGFIRRILALIYDSLAVLGIILSLSLFLVWSSGGYGEPGTLISYIQISIIFFSGPIFYSYFWINNNGQTIGMQAWKIRLVTSKELPLTLRQSFIRCLVSVLSALFLGLGYLWILINKEKLSWADIATNTKIVKTNQDKS